MINDFWDDEQYLKVATHLLFLFLGLTITLNSFLEIQSYGILAGTIITIRSIIDVYLSINNYLAEIAEEKSRILSDRK